MSKCKNKIRVSFIGTNNTDVTGSMTLITLPNKEKTQVLIECGLYQSNDSILNIYKINSRKFAFKPKNIKFIFLCHSHVDHIGLLSRLYKDGCEAKIISPIGNYDISKILMLDTAYIFQKDVESLKRKRKKDYAPIYNEQDVYACLQYWNEYDFNKKIMLDENFSFRFVSSGHILNSAQLELWINCNNKTSKILYTSDLGNVSIKNDYVGDFSHVDKCNLLIGETTYSNITERQIIQKDRLKDLEKIKSIIDDICLRKNGKVLIPTFANARTQQILTVLYDLYGGDDKFTIPIIIDSPMAIKITKLYANLLDGEQKRRFLQVLSWKNVKLCSDYSESQFYRNSKEPLVVLSSSGMATAGRSLLWIRDLLGNSKNHIIKVGYALEGTLMWKIKQGKQKTIKVENKNISNMAGLTELRSFSSHMQCEDLLNYYSEVQSDKICLVHGNFTTKLDFANALQKKISLKNKTSKVIVVNASTEVLI